MYFCWWRETKSGPGISASFLCFVSFRNKFFFFFVVFVFRWVLCLAVADSVFFDLYVAVLFAEPRC